VNQYEETGTMNDTPRDVNQIGASYEDSVINDVFSAEPAAFGKTTSQETQPVMPVTPQPTEKPKEPNTNDEVRYQYWQSQADKARNEKEALQDELNAMKAQSEQVQYNQQVEQPQAEVFPDPPTRPNQPSYFNREEAYSDPASESARYVNDMEAWRNDMTEYNTIKSDYVMAVQKDYIANQEMLRRNAEEADAKRAQMRAGVNSMVEQVKVKYGATDEQARAFITKMSKPEAVTVDGLWRLYNDGQHTQLVAQPSQQFQQTMNTQSIPSPMGVMPASTNQVGARSAEDIIMDSLIGDYKGSNPFG
jgi:hypothetical protein